MRVSSFAVARPAYYDRNATSVGNIYLGSAGPHGSTTRWTYTVASGKKLLVENVSMRVLRDGVATVAGTFLIEVNLTLTAGQYILDQTRQNSNTLNFVDFRTDQMVLTLYAGEIIYGQTYDSSTGGTVQYSINQKGTLYDA